TEVNLTQPSTCRKVKIGYGFAELEYRRRQSGSACERNCDAQDKVADVSQVGTNGIGERIQDYRSDDAPPPGSKLHSAFLSKQLGSFRVADSDKFGRNRNIRHRRAADNGECSCFVRI